MTGAESPRQIAGVLLAAGRGRRMGTLKQLLPWGAGSTLVAAAFDALEPHTNAGMIVVLGAEPDQVKAALADCAFQTVLSDPDAEMWESVKRGISEAMRIPGLTHILLHPADHPIILPDVVKAMVDEADEDLAVIPTCSGHGAHPVLIPKVIFPTILDWPGQGGLRAFWESHPTMVTRRELPDAEPMQRDFDTPDDYSQYCE